jgi:hypothetical protein
MPYSYTLSLGAGEGSGTAADLIRRALKLLGVLAAGESLSAEDQADGLKELNLLLGTWANERLAVYGTRRATYVLTPSLSPHTIGAGSAFASTRPVRIDGAGVIRAGETVELPLKVLTDSEYAGIGDKTLTSDTPQRLWVEWTHPTANLWLWPVPTTAATLVLYTWSQLTQLAAADRVDLPPGYENALAHALALQWAPMFGVEPSGTLQQNAADTIAAIRRTNAPDVVAELDAGILQGNGGVFDFRSGQ